MQSFEIIYQAILPGHSGVFKDLLKSVDN